MAIIRRPAAGEWPWPIINLRRISYVMASATFVAQSENQSSIARGVNNEIMVYDRKLHQRLVGHGPNRLHQTET